MKLIRNAAAKIVTVSDVLVELVSKMNHKQKEIVHKIFEFYMNQYRELKKTHNVESVVSTIHEEIDKKMEESSARIETGEKVTCRNGCSFCCFLKVDINDDEAMLLTEYSRKIGLDIDYEKLEKQKVKTDAEFLKLPYKDRRCIFLNKENSCSVYEHRPSACRKLLVVSKVECCDPENKSETQIKKLVNIEAEILSSSSLNVRESGGMVEMLLKTKN